MNFSRSKPLDWILIAAYAGFAGIEAYRYRTQGSVPMGDLVLAASSTALYWFSGYRTRKGSRNPSAAAWLTGVSLVALAVGVAFGLIWTFALSDSASQRWHHAAFSAGAIAVIGTILAWAVMKTSQPVERTPPGVMSAAPGSAQVRGDDAQESAD